MCEQEGLATPKTSQLVANLASLGIPQGKKVLLIVDEVSQNLALSCRNIPGVMLTTAGRLVVSEILRADKIVLEPAALKYIQVRFPVTTSQSKPCNDG